jgi:hypothetical protein
MTQIPPTSVDTSDAFWRTGEDLAKLAPPPPAPLVPALQRVGPWPFPKNRFPFLGFLATVYDHVAERMSRKRNG